MNDGPVPTIQRNLRHVLPPRCAGGVTDGELLDRFRHDQDEAAFELLVWRHGPLVLGVCRRVLRRLHDAEDAFQATFLTLARKAGSISRRGSVGSWLYKVAYRLALRARARSAQRSAREQPLGNLAVPSAGLEPGEALSWQELGPILDEELAQLPERYRAAFVLCHLQGKTNQEAAELLGCPKGTILSRLSRARERLRHRLRERGLGLGPKPFLRLISENGQALATVSPVLAHGTASLALLFMLGKLLGEDLPDRISDLLDPEVLDPWARRLQISLMAALLVAVGSLGLAAYAHSATTAAEPTFSEPPAVVDPAAIQSVEVKFDKKCVK
jgi:RNA polymerase sigma-70 factor (ECF subfamily)